MNIQKTQENDGLTLALKGRLDTSTAPELETCLKEALKDVRELTFDMSQLEYISSAGLRVLLAAQKTMKKQGSLKLTGVSEVVQEIFDITGFSDILTIE